MTQTTSATTPDQHAPTFVDRAARFTRILAAAAEAWDALTPCAGWSVRDVVAHVIDTQRDFLTGQGLDAGPVTDLADPAAAWNAHLDHVVGRAGKGPCRGEGVRRLLRPHHHPRHDGGLLRLGPGRARF
ncbi:maleylpyruvate isomerase N-terminal domain-containing protein [Ornithinimicrobium flavum]|uniref:maleylpyruvate isomerase N-terminal domain-containing protein n=1 Tax=Ornithinimicrobium flavum TaxID=1288636 RepID=UPI0010700387